MYNIYKLDRDQTIARLAQIEAQLPTLAPEQRAQTLKERELLRDWLLDLEFRS